jgi:hypothetical protein
MNNPQSHEPEAPKPTLAFLNKSHLYQQSGQESVHQRSAPLAVEAQERGATS